MLNPEIFPINEVEFFIQGPEGNIQTKAATAEANIAPVTVIICHPHPLFSGTMENKVVTTIFRSFRNMGSQVVRFNYRGVGKSEGSYADAIGETEDLRAVVEWVRQVSPDNQIWLAGFSFGSYVAYRLASQIDCQQLLTVAPAVTRFDFTQSLLPKCPWLIVQGDKDEVVEPEAVFSWYEDHVQPKATLIKMVDAGHFFHGRLIELREIFEQEFKVRLQSL